MTAPVKKSGFLSPALQARLLLWRIVLEGLARDYWKDAPFVWPQWIQKRIQALKKPRDPQPPKPPKVKPTPAVSAHKETGGGNSPAEPASRKAKDRPHTTTWTADRVQVMEQLWGEGHAIPGGDAYIEELSAPLGITQDMSILDLGAGLGGLPRYLAEKYKTYVTGFEMDPTLASRGMVMSIAAGLSKQASIVSLDPAAYTAARKYDCIFAREVFYKIIGKEKFFKAIDSSLKGGGGQFVFTDFILDPAVREKPAILHWLASERGAAPLSKLETIKLWKGMGYDLRIAEDHTEKYKDFILTGLRDLVVFMAQNVPDRETKSVMLREVDLWSKRLAALNQGLSYCRFYAIKY
ncbi:MAG: methyltransferase domain-containing protein [Alphaproteobacteria bacterium]|nr:methyltransferase domain-containing protein [Alphaproteobacteria bacterium]